MGVGVVERRFDWKLQLEVGRGHKNQQLKQF